MRLVNERRRNGQPGRLAALMLAGLMALCASWQAPHARADEPYARSKDYDLQHSRIALRFEVDKRKVIGDVTHSISILHDGTTKIWFDSVGLNIQSVTVNKATAKFHTTEERLTVLLPGAAKAGEKFDVQIKYDGK